MATDNEIINMRYAFRMASEKFNVSQTTEYEAVYAKPLPNYSRRVLDSNTAGFFKWHKNNESKWVPYSENINFMKFNNNIRLVPLRKSSPLNLKKFSNKTTQQNSNKAIDKHISNVKSNSDILNSEKEMKVRKTLSDSMFLSLKYEPDSSIEDFYSSTNDSDQDDYN